MTQTFIMLLVLSTKYRASCQIYTKLIFSLGCHRCPSLNFTTKNNLLRQILLSFIYAKMVTLSFFNLYLWKKPSGQAVYRLELRTIWFQLEDIAAVSAWSLLKDPRMVSLDTAEEHAQLKMFLS